MLQPKCARRTAFTLVELLVVIGIIALLVSVLLPALGAARRQANATRCATQLREIGNAIQLYATENKGFLPMVRHNAPANTEWPPVQTGSNRSYKLPVGINEYWYGYLLKYFTKGELLRNANGDVSLKNYEKTPMWGCPEVQKTEIDILNANSADYNSGYGMGPYLLYRPNTYRTVNGTPPGRPNAWHWNMIEGPTAGDKRGRYMKITEAGKPSDKGFVADSRAWFLEIRDPVSATVVPQQPRGYLAYDQFATDQFDRYRHGKYPSLDSGGYSRTGGKVLFNVMFLDGHVEALSDVKNGYRAFRGKYPG